MNTTDLSTILVAALNEAFNDYDTDNYDPCPETDPYDAKEGVRNAIACVTERLATADPSFDRFTFYRDATAHNPRPWWGEDEDDD